MRIHRNQTGTQTSAFAWASALFVFIATAIARGGVLDVAATGVISELSASYAGVTNATCTVRREVSLHGKASSVISKVVWARGDRLGVRTSSPEVCLTVITDGKVWQKTAKDKKWKSWKVEDQTGSQFASLRSVPGSPEEVIAPLYPASAVDIQPSSTNIARAVKFRFAGGDASKFAVLSFKGDSTLAAMDVFAQDEPETPISSTSFIGAMELLPGAFFYKRFETRIRNDKDFIETKTRYDDLRINISLPENSFSKDAFASSPHLAPAYAASGNPHRGAAASAAGGIVWFYRNFVGPAIGSRCALEPSCSQYFIDAAQCHGILCVPMIADRFVREPVASASDKWVLDAKGRPKHPDPVSDHDFWFGGSADVARR